MFLTLPKSEIGTRSDMGAYTCQYGFVHKVCRCPKPHKVICDRPMEHSPDVQICIVLEMKRDGRIPAGKHEAHPPHDWWYTSSGGGHQLDAPDEREKNLKKFYCPGGEV